MAQMTCLALRAIVDPPRQSRADPDFARLDDKDLFNLVHIDVLMAVSGYPIPILKNGKIHVLATIQNPRGRQRRPAELLKPNKSKAPGPAKTYTTDEFVQALKERGFPVTPEYEQQLREVAHRRQNELNELSDEIS